MKEKIEKNFTKWSYQIFIAFRRKAVSIDTAFYFLLYY
ncbi:hypothetical protein AC3_1364 [Clostridium perfringens E str. JGS1987]|uniref:Uncharacterized protein n=1 Tax=Clostridium perfringens E str. JGS1987 TaxID=451755 RepID=B1BY91_CLOPF|nr:hypothetical protein AC3_1364 [Clostridium perfringens E str. JGS1987]